MICEFGVRIFEKWTIFRGKKELNTVIQIDKLKL